MIRTVLPFCRRDGKYEQGERCSRKAAAFFLETEVFMDIGNKLAKLTTEQKVRLCIDPSSLRISGIPEEGIPGMRMTDGTSGLRILDVPDPDPKQAVFEQAINSSFDTEDALAITHPATCFPAGSSLAC